MVDARRSSLRDQRTNERTVIPKINSVVLKLQVVESGSEVQGFIRVHRRIGGDALQRPGGLLIFMRRANRVGR